MRVHSKWETVRILPESRAAPAVGPGGTREQSLSLTARAHLLED